MSETAEAAWSRYQGAVEEQSGAQRVAELAGLDADLREAVAGGISAEAAIGIQMLRTMRTMRDDLDALTKEFYRSQGYAVPD